MAPPKKKKPKKRAMPTPSLAPLSSRRRKKPVRVRISAAISLPEADYNSALAKADSHHDGNFSAYVRHLLRKDQSPAKPSLS